MVSSISPAMFATLVLVNFICLTNSAKLPYGTQSSSTRSSASATTFPMFNRTVLTYNTTYRPLFEQGWTPQPNGRGTIDIIWASCSTIFFCCWTALCLNVPPAEWSRWRWIGQKALMAGLGILGPEFHFQLALGQWVSARRSVESFKRSGYPDWSMSHAFLADMGGFVLHAKGWVDFPLNAKQVHYLVIEKYIPYSAVAVDASVLRDKNKGDGLVRFITVCQILWFSLNCLGRAVQQLAIATLELTTLGFIVCTLGTYYFWLRKPLDVGRAIILTTDLTMDEILIMAGDEARAPYKFTPLDFVDRDQSSWNIYWRYWMNILRKLNIVFATKKRPINKIPDDHFPGLSRGTTVILFLAQTGYAAIHVSGWDFHFPSIIERTLWHISTLAILVSICSYWLIDLFTWHLHPALIRRIFGKKGDSEATRHIPRLNFLTRIESSAARLRNNSPDHDPALDVPLKALVPLMFVAVCYCVARAYILLEDFMNLRALPPSAYESVNWSGFFPHF